MTLRESITVTNLEGVNLIRRGKVRDIYDLGSELLIVATDRISAFDCILPCGIPDKGKILTALSRFWFEYLTDLVPNHLVTMSADELPNNLKAHKDILKGRFMIVQKLDIVDVECVVRGYLSGSAYKDYLMGKSVCGVKLPDGLGESDKLPKPIFTPTSKAESGHDEPMTFEQVIEKLGTELADKLKASTIKIYEKASIHAESNGVIIADTKFEFGVKNGEVVLADEVLTPDSSRFWRVSEYIPGHPQKAFDKQYVRDYLESLDWDKNPPAPSLPEGIIMRTRERYVQAYEMLTGKNFLVD